MYVPSAKMGDTYIYVYQRLLAFPFLLCVQKLLPNSLLIFPYGNILTTTILLCAINYYKQNKNNFFFVYVTP